MKSDAEITGREREREREGEEKEMLRAGESVNGGFVWFVEEVPPFS